MPIDLTPERGLLFRITHIDNLPWLLVNGLHASTGTLLDPGFVPIGNPDLILKRAKRHVPIPPGGTLADYIPFYFTPKSPMLFNVATGYNGVVQRPNDEVAVLVSSCRQMTASGVTMLYTDRHAFAATATWMSDPAALAHAVDWDILRQHDFSRDDAYPDKRERYQAEALAHKHVPTVALRAIGCASDTACALIEPHVRKIAEAITVVARPNWFFR